MDAAAKKYPGKMAAILDLAFEKVRDICFKSGAEIANLNCPGQIVITGTIEAVDKARVRCLEEGAKRAVDLEVGGGFHSPLLFEASGELKLLLDEMHMIPPRAPVISNYSAAEMVKPAQIKQNLVYQIYSGIRWEGSMRFMLAQGINKFYEFGPGKVLKGLMRKIEPAAQVINIEKKEDVLSLAG